ncbi:hypothetical protein L2W42_21845 (plasmid) [Rhizobium gallicum]|nr:hypothetical protein [Rhizobium gallicum]ULJ74489.1 hypothetical protein L2W42_21845 [Rhizobium gallicum]
MVAFGERVAAVAAGIDIGVVASTAVQGIVAVAAIKRVGDIETGDRVVAGRPRLVEQPDAELNWGFWTGILAKRYETSLWRPHLRSVFQSADPLTRGQIFVPLDDLRRLRNRIAHHEPILNRNIAADYQAILDLVGYICPTTAAWVDGHSQVAAILATKP